MNYVLRMYIHLYIPLSFPFVCTNLRRFLRLALRSILQQQLPLTFRDISRSGYPAKGEHTVMFASHVLA